MPELPEVETVRNTLKNLVVGRKICDIEIKYTGIIRDVSVLEFKNKLINQKINDIERIGKYLIFILDDYALISHLRMEGKYFYRKDGVTSKHDHVIFSLDDDHYLVYNDTRKFGTMNIELLNNYKNAPYILKLGYEPGDEKLSAQYLYDKLHKKNSAIKTALLDQTVISGLGNIYVDEVIFLSKLMPTDKCSSLSLSDFENIVISSKIVIDKAISEGGTTIKSFSYEEGVHGRFQNSLNVHTKKECGVCNSKIVKIKVNGRGTYYCPKCQG